MAKPIVVLLQELENELIRIKAELEEIQKNTTEKNVLPYTKTGGGKDQSQQKAVDISTGLSQTFGGAVIWNDVELRFPAFGTRPVDSPTKGYNRHSHSRYSGGALDINTLEIVEYDVDWETGDFQKDCQSLWRTYPSIKKDQNSKKENVNKIGLLDLVFNADTLKWGTVAYEIDVKKCYLVLRDDDGNIELDENENEKKALLYNEDETKTNIVWDKYAKCWRIYAIYAEEPEA